jgi:ATP-dependent DNA ligase
LLRECTRPGLGIIEPCLPSPAKAPLADPGWLREIKHDGFRILARRDSAGVRLISRAGNEFSGRLSVYCNGGEQAPGSVVLYDGEAIVCDENGLAVFELICRHGTLASAVLCAFDLLELDGRDLRREPIEVLLAKLQLLVPRTRLWFRLFQFPLVSQTSKNCGECDDDYSDNAQAKSDREKQEKQCHS